MLPALLLWMDALATLETNLLTTFAHRRFLKQSLFLDEPVAVWARTPLKFRVEVNVDVELEPQKLFVDLARPKLADLVIRELDLAAQHHAGDLHDVAIGHIHQQVFRQATPTELVVAAEAEKRQLVRLSVADLAKPRFDFSLRFLK